MLEDDRGVIEYLTEVEEVEVGEIGRSRGGRAMGAEVDSPKLEHLVFIARSRKEFDHNAEEYLVVATRKFPRLHSLHFNGRAYIPDHLDLAEVRGVEEPHEKENSEVEYDQYVQQGDEKSDEAVLVERIDGRGSCDVAQAVRKCKEAEGRPNLFIS